LAIFGIQSVVVLSGTAAAHISLAQNFDRATDQRQFYLWVEVFAQPVGGVCIAFIASLGQADAFK
jgi:hypothetical protein